MTAVKFDLSSVRTALAPVAAFAVALGGLTAWTAAGAAGTPAELSVTRARMLLPSNPDITAAFFDIRNEGGADDELVRITSPATDGRIMLSRNIDRNGVGTMRMVESTTVPADDTLRMSTSSVDVMVDDPPPLRAGDRMPFTLHFRDSDPIRVEALVVPAGRL
ncbi:copper chaperone PCu(A)C [Streptomyces sp. LX-29]|uniref:copper chaperone PCu(A)C n=1 Tax=Streptomyces sp. LX-29 TaxID=2900152 RepID=UPI00240E19FE|nr:copper chaperone PCu(A)C [Streptomyces sp. LX-29]WFB06493.1 copper chaperone PCu(A)C [Streptomyces sp. LX-29]